MIADDKEITILKEAYIYYNARGHNGVKKILLDNGIDENRSLELIKNERSITDRNLNEIKLIQEKSNNSLIGEYLSLKLIIITTICIAIWVGLKIFSKSSSYSQFINQ